MIIECVRCFRVPGKDYYKVKVRYWVLGADRKRLIDPSDSPSGMLEEIKINASDMRKWKVWHPPSGDSECTQTYG